MAGSGNKVNPNPIKDKGKVSNKLKIIRGTAAPKMVAKIKRDTVAAIETDVEPDIEVIKIPPAPKEFLLSQKKLYRKIAKQLVDKRLIDLEDFELIKNFVIMQDAINQCTDHINANGLTLTNLKGEVMVNPHIKIRQESMSRAHALSRSLGLDPKSRSDIETNNRRTNKVEDSHTEDAVVNSFSKL